MRNLAQYPATREEVLALLDELTATFNAEGNVGDMRPLLLSYAREVVRKHAPEAFPLDPREQKGPGSPGPLSRAASFLLSFRRPPARG